MSAEAFHVCYGMRQVIDVENTATVEALENRRHPWQIAAKQHRLQSLWGITKDEQKYFLIVGRIIGHFGWESESDGQLSDVEAASINIETTERLRAAGIDGSPAWYFQFEPDR